MFYINIIRSDGRISKCCMMLPLNSYGVPLRTIDDRVEEMYRLGSLNNFEFLMYSEDGVIFKIHIKDKRVHATIVNCSNLNVSNNYIYVDVNLYPSVGNRNKKGNTIFYIDASNSIFPLFSEPLKFSPESINYLGKTKLSEAYLYLSDLVTVLNKGNIIEDDV